MTEARLREILNWLYGLYHDTSVFDTFITVFPAVLGAFIALVTWVFYSSRR